jgi:hypothetical protein
VCAYVEKEVKGMRTERRERRKVNYKVELEN